MIEKDKLTTTYTLTIRPEYEGLIALVASMNGWDGQGDPREHMKNVVNNLVKTEIQLMIKGSLDRFYGVSQAALITQAMSDYDGSAETASEWSVVEEEV